MRIFLRVSFIIFLLPSPVFSQSDNSGALNDEGFLHYLIKNEFYSDAASVIRNRTDSTDTLQYLKGLYYFRTNKFDSASYFFDKVGHQATGLNDPALVYQNAALLFGRKKIESPVDNKIQTDTSRALLNLIANASLALRRDALSLHQKQQSNPLDLLPEENALITQRINEWSLRKRKSAFTAGALSAIVPGLGKVYAHKPKQGLSAFMLVSVFGLDAWDGYRHRQFSSPQFYIFGGLFTLFYVGNIWGSTAEVKLQNKKFDEQTDKDILDAVDGSIRRTIY